jgi:hypothetical protein
MNSGIANRIVRALDALYKNDLEEALYQIAPALDATAKKRYPKKKPTQRVRSFVKDEQDLIYGLSTQNRFVVEQGAAVAYGDYGEFQSVLYKFVRCAQSHDAAVDTSKVTLGGNFGIGFVQISGASLTPRPGTILISFATVLALIFSVVCAIENRMLDLSMISIPFLSEPQMELSPFVGNRSAFIQKYTDIFK